MHALLAPMHVYAIDAHMQREHVYHKKISSTPTLFEIKTNLNPLIL